MEELIKNDILSNKYKGLMLEDNEGKVVFAINNLDIFIDPNYKLIIDENEDEIITCKNCKQDFLFSYNERNFYEQKGFLKPVRCKECRAAKKQQQ